MKRLVLIFVLIINSLFIIAQNISINGVVYDETTSDYLPGANVYVLGTTNGTITDMDGKYSISASLGDTLVFSFIGFTDKKIAVTGNTNIEVGLKSTLAEVDEVVVIGYGYTKKSDLTGAVGSIGEDMMKQSTNTNITEALQGRMAGVQVTSAEGSPGGGLNIKVRGASSINANSQPLYVIDGIPVEVDELSFDDGIPGAPESPINDIDPENIESIEILKDASATAIYGSRGANGVVMITTKKGQSGKSVIDFSVSNGFQTAPVHLDLMDSPEYAKFMYGKTPSATKYQNWESYKDSTNTNWQEEMFGIGLIQNYNLRVSGGTQETKYSVGGGYFNHNGLIGDKSFERYSGNFRLNQKVGEKISVDAKFSVGSTSNDGLATGGDDTPKAAGLIRQIMRSPPTRETDYNVESIDDQLDEYSELDNPLNFVNNASRLSKSNRLLGKIELKYNIIDNLTFTTRGGANYATNEFRSFFPKETGKGRNTGGVAKLAHREKVSLVSESFVNYSKQINYHSFNVMAAATVETSNSFQFEAENQKFDISTLGYNSIESGINLVKPNSEPVSNSLLSYLGRVQYNFSEKYLFTGSFRADGTSRFLVNKWGYFPSASAAWRVSEEYFFEPLKVAVSNMKLRASYGQTGNQSVPSYISYSQMTVNNYTYNNTTVSGLAITAFGNPNLKWEKTESINAGVEIGFLKNRFSTTVDYYIKRTSDMLMLMPLPETSGFTQFWENVGNMDNRGVEISITTTNIDNQDFKWTTDFNIAFNRNTITELGGGNNYMPVAAANNMINGKAYLIEGEAIGTWWGYETNGIYKSQADLDSLPTSYGAQIGEWRMVDQNNDGIINDEDRTIIGRAEPLHFGGLVNSFKYRQLSLDLFLSWSYGGVIYNANKWDLLDMGGNNFNRLVQANEAWIPEGGITGLDEDGNEYVVIPENPEGNRPAYAASNHDMFISDYIEDASYLRIKTLTVSYSLKKKMAKKVGFKDLKFYVRGENLFTFTKYSGYDPEVDMQMGTRGLAPGIDYGSYPRARTFTLGLNIKI